MNEKIPPVPGSMVPPVPSFRQNVPGEMTMPINSQSPVPGVPPVPQAPRPVRPVPPTPVCASLPEIEYVVSHVRGFFMNASGGRLHINANEFYFRPHAVNFNTITYRWTYDQIAGYSKGFMTYMKIHLTDGRSETIQTYKKDAVINALEKYRQAWFAARGLIAPPVRR